MTVEGKRSVLEAREWLRLGYTSKSEVQRLKARIAKRRGAEAAERLYQEMRKQWAIKAEWMGDSNG